MFLSSMPPSWRALTIHNSTHIPQIQMGFWILYLSIVIEPRRRGLWD